MSYHGRMLKIRKGNGGDPLTTKKNGNMDVHIDGKVITQCREDVVFTGKGGNQERFSWNEHANTTVEQRTEGKCFGGEGRSGSFSDTGKREKKRRRQKEGPRSAGGTFCEHARGKRRTSFHEGGVTGVPWGGRPESGGRTQGQSTHERLE